MDCQQPRMDSHGRSVLVTLLVILGAILWLGPIWRVVLRSDYVSTTASDAETDNAKSAMTETVSLQIRSDRMSAGEPLRPVDERSILLRTAQRPAFAHRDVTVTEFVPPVGNEIDAAGEKTDRRRSLNLTGTVIGIQQRAAIINEQLCLEGTECRLAGERFHIDSVQAKYVVLSCDEDTIELMLPSCDTAGCTDACRN